MEKDMDDKGANLVISVVAKRARKPNIKTSKILNISKKAKWHPIKYNLVSSLRSDPGQQKGIKRTFLDKKNLPDRDILIFG